MTSILKEWKRAEGAGVGIDPPSIGIFSGMTWGSCKLHIAPVVLLPEETQPHLAPACDNSPVKFVFNNWNYRPEKRNTEQNLQTWRRLHSLHYFCTSYISDKVVY
jgi:hypothetical protein